MSETLTAREAAVTARAATAADTDPIAATLGRAFHDDPLICFLLRDEATRATKIPQLFRLLFRLGLPYGACDVTSGFEAAAIWRPPGEWHIPISAYITNLADFLGLFGLSGGLHVMRVMDVVERRHPSEPHWYLQAIGTDTEKQGKGYGGVVIRRHIAIADEGGAPCYLESSKERNIPVYQSFGFEVTGEIKLPDGPTIWPMWRKARGA